LIKADPNAVFTDYGALRTGRTGAAMMASGLYLWRVSLNILIPDKADKAKVAEAHDGNAWEYYSWKRMNLIFVVIWLLFLSLAVIQFSFSALFGA
jgi:hypothetical protein